MKFAILIPFVLMAFGCVSNGYREFYHDKTGGQPLAKLPVILPVGEPRMVAGRDPTMDSKAMLENGYLMLGYSSFNGAMQDQNNALEFGKTIFADTVIVYSKFTNSVSGAMPVQTPTTQTSYSTANATAYGSNGGWANAYGTGTTTTYGTTTEYIPYTVSKYDQGAQYWIKAKTPILGLMVKDLSDEKRKELGTNRGVEVYIVIKGSPAYLADIVDGDVIKSIGNTNIDMEDNYYDAVGSNAGKATQIKIIRGDKTILKTVQFNPRAT